MKNGTTMRLGAGISTLFIVTGIAHAQEPVSAPLTVPVYTVQSVVVRGTRGISPETVQETIAAVALRKLGDSETLRAVAQAVTELYRNKLCSPRVNWRCALN